jgi:hypothetical protein
MTADDWREAYEERAAIMEFDGKMTRAEAEKAAMADIQRQMRESRWTGSLITPRSTSGQ